MAYRSAIFGREELSFHKKPNDTFSVSSIITQRRKPSIMLCVESSVNAKVYARTEIDTFSHLDQIFEALLHFERYAVAVTDDARQYASNRGANVGAIKAEGFSQ